MKRNLIIAGLTILAIGGIYFYSKTAIKPNQLSNDTMRIGSYYWPGMYWANVAEEQGFFKEAGLKVELVDTSADFYGSQTDVIEGRLDTQDFYLYDLMLHKADGADLAMVLNSDASTGSEGLIADKGIDEFSDLKGKRIGVEESVVTEFILYTLLRQNNLKTSDIKLIHFKTEELAERFINNEIDAYLAWEPLLSPGLEKAGSKKIWDTADTPGIISAGYVFRREYIKQKPGHVQAFVKVWKKTTEFMVQNPKQSYAILAKVHNDTPQNVEDFLKLDKILDYEENLKAYSLTGGFRSLPGQVKLIKLYLQNEKKVNVDVDFTEILEPKFLYQLQ